MPKSPIDMSALKAFASRILKRHSKQSDQADVKPTPQETIDKVMGLLGELKKVSSPETAAKIKLAELILPGVVKKDKSFDVTQAKLWAFACGEMVGMLAGTILSEDKVDGAIEEVMKLAKVAARDISGLGGLGLTGKKKAAAKVTTPSTPPISARATKMSFIGDLESQMASESNLEVKMALKEMADRLRAEVGMVDSNPTLERKV